jgi:hypothetical protein
MSYQTQWALTYDDAFVSRCRACQTQQADQLYRDAADKANAALAAGVLRGEAAPLGAFQSILPTTPGFADSADAGDGAVDSSRITDLEILAAVQAEWSGVAALYFGSDGAPLT